MSAHSHPPRLPFALRSSRGFTLLELLITLSIAAILLAVAIPSYQGIVQRNAVAAHANDLIGALNYARSEAVTRGAPVIVCQSADQLTCTTDEYGWSEGWIVYAPTPPSTQVTDDNRLRVKSALDGQVRISGNALIEHAIAFDARGFTRQVVNGSLATGTFTVTGGDAAPGTDIVISSSGRVRSEPAGEESS